MMRERGLRRIKIESNTAMEIDRAGSPGLPSGWHSNPLQEKGRGEDERADEDPFGEGIRGDPGNF